MAAQQSPVPASSKRSLPPVNIDGHALFEFSMRINRALRRLEHHFGAHQCSVIPSFRKTWQPPPKKPR